MGKTILLIVAWLTTIFLIIVNILENPSNFFLNGTIVLGWLLFVLQLTWNQSEKFYLMIKKKKLFTLNPDCYWNMEVEYKGGFSRNIFNVIDLLFVEQSNSKIVEISNVRKIYSSGSLRLEIFLDEYEERLIVSIDDMEVSYRRSNTLLENELGKLLEELSYEIKADHSLYSLVINFIGSNPYYGFFIRKLSIKDIQYFNVKFNIKDDKVKITKNSIHINTTTLQKLNSLSKKFITLSPR